MEDQINPHYDQSDEALENFDFIRKQVPQMLAGADGFVVFCVYVTGNDEYDMKMAGAIRNVPAPVMLAEAQRKLRDLREQAEEDWPDG